MKLVTVFLFAFLRNGVLLDPAIPSKEDQANVLKCLDEVFQAIRVLVNEEGGVTDTSSVIDIQHMVVQAMNYLLLVEELTLLKLSTTPAENSTCKSNARHLVEKTVVEGEEQLQACLDQALGVIYNNSRSVRTTVSEAMNRGDGFLDALNKCAHKPALQMVSCYKKLMVTDVFPLKVVLVNALDVHKSAHFDSISAKQRSIECVDDVVAKRRDKVEQILNDALKTCV
ncbi:hypothetical protein PPYR_13993 [Photinus pyralis]|uniref:Uncharacterized protein n=1 Tax=Photinus pyralis TaxID=7054 RepID=A0A5N4A410_PHOPY|nr:uncharacterized protein LOC116180716 [Photinus pyralis]KAB0792032.1 hypothetical protein PPYR_13993 [Photinus pyralis]